MMTLPWCSESTSEVFLFRKWPTKVPPGAFIRISGVSNYHNIIIITAESLQTMCFGLEGQGGNHSRFIGVNVSFSKAAWVLILFRILFRISTLIRFPSGSLEAQCSPWVANWNIEMWIAYWMASDGNFSIGMVATPDWVIRCSPRFCLVPELTLLLLALAQPTFSTATFSL